MGNIQGSFEREKKSLNPTFSTEKLKYDITAGFYLLQGETQYLEDLVCLDLECDVVVNTEHTTATAATTTHFIKEYGSTLSKEERECVMGQEGVVGGVGEVIDRVLEKPSFFGLFDGHNGFYCAEFLQENLLSTLLAQETFPSNIPTALSQSFQEVDSFYLNIAQKESYDDGSSALVGVIYNDVIYISNSGDSQGYLCYGDLATPITEILEKNGFGNLKYKNSKQLTVNPLITTFKVTSNVKFLLFGTWTFWHNITPQESTEHVLNTLNQKSNITEDDVYGLCLELVTKASVKTPYENISCLLLVFTQKSNLFN